MKLLCSSAVVAAAIALTGTVLVSADHNEEASIYHRAGRTLAATHNKVRRIKSLQQQQQQPDPAAALDPEEHERRLSSHNGAFKDVEVTPPVSTPSADTFSADATATNQDVLVIGNATAASTPYRRSNEQREALRQCVKWGVGLEHESMLVHRNEDGLEEYVLDAGRVLREMSVYGPVHGLSRELHEYAIQTYQDGAEFSGRRCANLQDLSFKAMVESVTSDFKELTLDSAWDQLVDIDEKLVKIAEQYPHGKRVIEELGFGPVSRPRTGMSAELGMYKRSSAKFFHCASCGSCSAKDYTGSYHMSITLPSTPDGKIARNPKILKDRNTCVAPVPGLKEGVPVDPKVTRDWVDAHTNFGNMVQWIEPLLVAVHGSADAHAVCDAGKFTEGSFRTMATGWGTPGTTDLRTFKDYGTGRYVKEGFEWVFPDDPTLVPDAYRESLSGCMKEGMGADIRIKNKIDEHLMGPNDILPPMNINEGIEIRIFDSFPIEFVPQVYRMLALTAEASRTHEAPEYMYGSEEWASAIQSVMKEGWNAMLPIGYIEALLATLNLVGVKVPHRQAYQVFETIYSALWDKHKKGMWVQLLLDEIPDKMPQLTIPNRESWQIGARNAGLSPERVMQIFGLEADFTGELAVADIHLREGSNNACFEDLEDMIYLADSYGMVEKIVLGAQGEVVSFNIKDKSLWKDVIIPTCKTAVVS